MTAIKYGFAGFTASVLYVALLLACWTVIR